MARGRRPKPTALKALQGTLRKDRANPDEPRIEPAAPEPLPGLDAMERRHFDEWVQHLLSVRVVTPIDGGALSNLVIAQCRMIRAKRKLQSGRKTVTDEGKLSAWAQELQRAQQLYHRLCVEFGMTPSSRTKVKATPARPTTVETPREKARGRFFGGGSA